MAYHLQTASSFAGVVSTYTYLHCDMFDDVKCGEICDAAEMSKQLCCCFFVCICAARFVAVSDSVLYLITYSDTYV